MEKIIDDSYKKSTILTFIPEISRKSTQLVESKYERIGDCLLENIT